MTMLRRSASTCLSSPNARRSSTSPVLASALAGCALLSSACAGNFTLADADLSFPNISAVVGPGSSAALTVEFILSPRTAVATLDCPVLDAATAGSLDGIALQVDRGGATLPAGCRTPSIRGVFTAPTGGGGELVLQDATSTIHVTAPALGGTLWMTPSFAVDAVPSGALSFALPLGDDVQAVNGSLFSNCTEGEAAYDAATGTVAFGTTRRCAAGESDSMTASVFGVLRTTIDERPVVGFGGDGSGIGSGDVAAAPIAPPTCSIDDDCVALGAGTTCTNGLCDGGTQPAAGLSMSSSWTSNVLWGP